MSIPDPHDRFFREVFSRREVVEDVLREYAICRSLK